MWHTSMVPGPNFWRGISKKYKLFFMEFFYASRWFSSFDTKATFKMLPLWVAWKCLNKLLEYHQRPVEKFGGWGEGRCGRMFTVLFYFFNKESEKNVNYSSPLPELPCYITLSGKNPSITTFFSSSRDCCSSMQVCQYINLFQSSLHVCCLA